MARDKSEKLKTALRSSSGARKTGSVPQERQRASPGFITQHPPAFNVGDHISHPQFGDGVVTGVDGGVLTITFADDSRKKILGSFVKRRS
jgi:DNA helicase II / ATP-dependent DNA helicase PcrA